MTNARRKWPNATASNITKNPLTSSLPPPPSNLDRKISNTHNISTEPGGGEGGRGSDFSLCYDQDVVSWRAFYFGEFSAWVFYNGEIYEDHMQDNMRNSILSFRCECVEANFAQFQAQQCRRYFEHYEAREAGNRVKVDRCRRGCLFSD